MFSKIIKNSFLIVLLYLLSCESTNEPVDNNEIKFQVILQLQLYADFEHIDYTIQGDVFYYDSQISIDAGTLTISNLELTVDSSYIDGVRHFRGTYKIGDTWDSINNMPAIGKVSKWGIEGDKEIGLSSLSIDYYAPEAIFITSPKQNEDISINEGVYIRWKDPDYFNDFVYISYDINKGDSHDTRTSAGYRIENTGSHYISFDTIYCEVNDRIKIKVLSMIDTAFQINNSKVNIFIAYGTDETYKLVE